MQGQSIYGKEKAARKSCGFLCCVISRLGIDENGFMIFVFDVTAAVREHVFY